MYKLKFRQYDSVSNSFKYYGMNDYMLIMGKVDQCIGFGVEGQKFPEVYIGDYVLFTPPSKPSSFYGSNAGKKWFEEYKIDDIIMTFGMRESRLEVSPLLYFRKGGRYVKTNEYYNFDLKEGEVEQEGDEEPYEYAFADMRFCMYLMQSGRCEVIGNVYQNSLRDFV